MRCTLAIALLLSLVAAAASAETVTYENESTPSPGVRLLERHTSGPNRRIYAAFVSLCHDGVRIDARSSQAVRITSAAWGSAMGADLAVNGDFYRTDRSTPTVYGDAVGVGERWPTARTGLASAFAGDWYYRKYGWIAFGDGWVEVNHSKWAKHNLDLGIGWHVDEMTTEIPAGTRALVSGFPELVVEGTALSTFPDRGDMADRHPRTAMGLTRDRKTFILVVVDGRSSQSVGMNGGELAALMHELGAYTAFNLDGGGSSQMWLRGQGTINAPSDGSPRPVANHWGVFAGGEGAPTSCFEAGGCFASPLPGAVGSRFADLADDASDAGAAALVVDGGLLAACNAEPVEMFCPKCELTRRDALAMIVRAAGLDISSPPATPTFSDVSPGAPAYAEIEAAAAAGIAHGCGDGAFCPDDAVTRGAFAAFLARARGWSAPADAPSFTDVPADDALAADIAAYAAHCVDDGCGDGAFCPDRVLDRKRGAALAVRGFDLDGSNPCANEDPSDPDTPGEDPGGDPDGDPDGAQDPSSPDAAGMAGSCGIGGGAGGGCSTVLVALVIALVSVRLPRRRQALVRSLQVEAQTLGERRAAHGARHRIPVAEAAVAFVLDGHAQVAAQRWLRLQRLDVARAPGGQVVLDDLAPGRLAQRAAHRERVDVNHRSRRGGGGRSRSRRGGGSGIRRRLRWRRWRCVVALAVGAAGRHHQHRAIDERAPPHAVIVACDATGARLASGGGEPARRTWNRFMEHGRRSRAGGR